MLTVTIEDSASDTPEIHLHLGGQGFWVARLVVELGVPVVLVAPFGGEVGAVLRALLPETGIEVRACPIEGSNGVYVHDRRSGERTEIAEMAPTTLSRHEVDELYGTALVEALSANVCVLAGSGVHPVLPAEVYERLAHDLGAGGVTSVADLSGPYQEHALRGGISVLKVALEELQRDGWITSEDDTELVGSLHRLAMAGAGAVVATRAERGALAFTGAELLAVRSPALQPVETRGAGDSLTAGLAAGLARGATLREALRLGAAAGALNVTRHGLGSGERQDIERFIDHIDMETLETYGG